MINPFRRLFANSMNRQYALGLRSILCVAAGLLILLEALPAAAADLKERLTPEVMAIVFPNAGKLGNEEGKPPAIPVYQGDQITGYIFSTLDIVAAPGYSSVPFDVIAGVDLTGRVTGAKVIFHREPYIMNDTRRQGLLDTFLQRHNGMALQGGNSGVLPPDYVQSATVSARAMRGAIFDSARLVLRSRGGRPKVNVPTLDLESFQIATWEQLLEKGAVVKRRFTSGDVVQARPERHSSRGRVACDDALSEGAASGGGEGARVDAGCKRLRGDDQCSAGYTSAAKEVTTGCVRHNEPLRRLTYRQVSTILRA